MIQSSCRKHGSLNEKNATKIKDRHRPSGFKLRCNECYEQRIKENIKNHHGEDFVLPSVLVGNCKKHGALKEEDGFVCIDRTSIKGYRLRCKICFHDISKTNYFNNRSREIDRVATWKKENRERINAQIKEDAKNNPEKYKKWRSDFYNRHRDEISLKRSLKERKMQRGDYEKMALEQNNKCAICKQEEYRMSRNGKQRTRLCIDHDHDTNMVRELLCHDCNSALGKFKDSPELLLEAADYLIKHKGWAS